MATVELFIRMGALRVRLGVHAADPGSGALRGQGLRRGGDGQIPRSGRIFAKVSRDEIARHFLMPAPEQMLHALVAEGRLTAEEEAALAAEVPIAEDITAEADSGGHTDNRALTVLLPRLIALRDEIAEQYGYAVPPRVGAAGGIGTPPRWRPRSPRYAAYVLTGSVNQSALRAGCPRTAATSGTGPGHRRGDRSAADMFEMGVTVQVLKRGTMFAQRGQRLTEFYRKYNSFDEAPPTRCKAWRRRCCAARSPTSGPRPGDFFSTRDPREIARAESDPHHLMALVFRWYLFSGAQWARGVTPTAAATTRSGAAPRWADSTMGQGASSNPSAPAPPARSPSTCSKVRRPSPAPASYAPRASNCRPAHSISAPDHWVDRPSGLTAHRNCPVQACTAKRNFERHREEPRFPQLPLSP